MNVATNINVSTAEPSSKFWREPMMWLVIGLPLSAVIASVWLLVKLSGDPLNDVVRDDVQRVAEAQVVNLAPDELAQQRGLAMLLSVVDDRLELRTASGELPQTGALHLLLAHPLDASQDRELLLQPDGDVWRTDAPATDHDWNITVTAQDGAWRITGRLLRDGKAALLQSTLARR
ncbi:MAG: FixH family protein [Nevskiaceae bacterium]|jgi:hypothetical protein|nr:FixH family protein [Nevskiaceae bacterium]